MLEDFQERLALPTEHNTSLDDPDEESSIHQLELDDITSSDLDEESSDLLSLDASSAYTKDSSMPLHATSGLETGSITLQNSNDVTVEGMERAAPVNTRRTFRFY